MSSAVASHYARAFVDLILDAQSPLAPDAAVEQLRSFEAALAGSVEFQRILMSPAVPAIQKRGVVRRLAGPLGLSALVERLLFVMIDHRRMGLLSGVRAALQEQLDERRGIVHAQVTSAHELSPDERDLVGRKLADRSGKQVRCEFAVDPTLLGGLVARVGTTVYDGSVRGQLRGLRERLVR